MEFDFLDLVSLILVFVSFLLAAFFLSTTSENALSNKLLAAFLIFSAIDSIPYVLMEKLYGQYPGWSLLLSTTVAFKIPLVFLYVRSVAYTDDKLSRFDIVHFLPFVVINLLFVPEFYLVNYQDKINFMYKWFDGIAVIQIAYVIIHLQVILYLILSFFTVGRYRKVLLENYSDESNFSYKWLFQFLVLFAFNFLITLFKNLFLFMGVVELHSVLLVIGQLLFLVFVCWIFWKALKQPGLFHSVYKNIQTSSKLIKENKVSIQEKEQVKDEIEMVIAYMSDSKPFLDPGLTLESLAMQLKFFPRDLSILINQHLGQHFFDFVNSYRIETAKQMILNSDDDKLTILEVLYQVGFNSKSSFNTAFKKHTGMTPTEFKGSMNKAA